MFDFWLDKKLVLLGMTLVLKKKKKHEEYGKSLVKIQKCTGEENNMFLSFLNYKETHET